MTFRLRLLTTSIVASLVASTALLAACGDDGTVTPIDSGTADAPPAPPGCPTGTSECGATCVDLDVDRAHCGACDAACAAGEACVDAECTIVCPSGQVECDGHCASTSTDRFHCGTCGVACEAGEVCSAGRCELRCPSGQVGCGGACVDTSSDPQHCGACDGACAADEVCSKGSCASFCGAGLTDCSGACVDTDDDPAHCSACDAACTAPLGATGLCMAGACRVACDSGLGDCNGDIDAAGGDGCETPLGTDPANCGACNRVCELPNAVAGCGAGACVVAACDAGFGDCDGAPLNGCEADLAVDAANCGTCGDACASTERCASGACLLIAGEDCSAIYALAPGLNTVTWTAAQQDYLTAAPSCGASSAPAGPDIVLGYTAASDQRVTLRFTKPASTRWDAVVSTAACGMLSPALACISDFTATSMTGSFLMTGGETAYVYAADTASGTLPLDNPLLVEVQAADCGSAPPVSFDPPNGATTTSRWPVLTARFGAPVIPTGTVTITGDAGTLLTYDVAASPEVSFDTTGTVMTIDPRIAFPPGEMLTMSWADLRSLVCTTTVPIPPPTWVVNVLVPPCLPGAGGVVGTTVTRIPTGIASFSENFVAADEDPAGWVYTGGSSNLYRIPKAGGAVQDVEALAPLTASHLGFDMLVDGMHIYTLESNTTATVGQLFRISTNGGATWTVQDYATLPMPPGDDFRGVTEHAGRIYMVTDESSTIDTEIWSVPAGATSLPVAATLDRTFTGWAFCMGIARDTSFYYLVCSTNDEVLRLPVASGPPEVLTNVHDTSASKNAIHGEDLDADGVFDVLYFQTSFEEVFLICNPATPTPYVDRLVDVGGENSNFGLGFDRTNNVLWMIDDDTRELISIR